MSHDFRDYAQPMQYRRPSGGNSTLKWVAIICGIAVVGVFLCCGGGLLLMNVGAGVIAADIERQLRDHPQIRESLGELESVEVNWGHTIALGDDNSVVYDVKGSIGSGEITVNSITGDDGNEEIIWATLRLSNGEEIELSFD